MNPGLLILLAAGVLFLMNKGATTTTPPPANTLTTDQKRKAIISWWETSTPPLTQDTDGGRFIDIISSIAPAEIDSIYTYVFTYVLSGTRPAAGTPLYNAMQTIISNYSIFV